MREVNYELLPEHIRGGMKMYLEDGIEPGSFCVAVLENNLSGAFGRADDVNVINMHSIVQWLYNKCPRIAWGNTEKVYAWIKSGGFNGQKGI